MSVNHTKCLGTSGEGLQQTLSNNKNWTLLLNIILQLKSINYKKFDINRQLHLTLTGK